MTATQLAHQNQREVNNDSTSPVPLPLNAANNGTDASLPVYTPQNSQPASESLSHQREQAADNGAFMQSASAYMTSEPTEREGFRFDLNPDLAFSPSRHNQIADYQMASQLESDIFGLDFNSQEPYAAEPDAPASASASTSKGASTDSFSEEGCFCVSDLMHYLNGKMDVARARSSPLGALRALNEVSERLILCGENHSSLWYCIMLALYQDTEERLGPTRECREMLDEDSRDRISQPSARSNKTGMAALDDQLADAGRDTSAILKAFTVLSTVAVALPFKLRMNSNMAPSREFTSAFAKKLQETFEKRLIRATDTSG